MTRRRHLARPLLVLALLAACLAAPGSAADAPATWRLDYFHTGGPGIGSDAGSTGEPFAVDRIVVEPLAWPGNPAGYLDTSGTGLYRFQVMDAAGAAVYSRGFNSIYGEWETTAEAGEVNRTFHESLRFPGLFGDPPAPPP